MSEIATLCVTGMTCATCSGAIEKLLRPLNGINKANVSLLMNQAVIEFDPTIIKIDEIIEEIEDIGFTANLSSITTKDEEKTASKRRKTNKKIDKSNIIIWSTKINGCRHNDITLDTSYFYNIFSNESTSIIKIVFAPNVDDQDEDEKSDQIINKLSIYFDKSQILPMSITHKLQSKGIEIGDINLTQQYPAQVEVTENKEENMEYSELKRITFCIGDMNENIFDLKSIETHFGTKLIDSIDTKKDIHDNNKLLVMIGYFDIISNGKSTARMIYEYLQIDIGINKNKIAIIDAMSMERDEFRATQIAIVRKIQKQFYWSCLFGVPCFIIAMILPYIPWINDNILMYNPIPHNHSVDIMGILLFLLATPVQFWIGRTFYISAWNAAKHKTSNMSTLIALGTTVAWIYSFIALIIGFIAHDDDSLHGASHFFETSATVITIVLLGKWLQAKAKFKTCDAIGMLMDMQSPFATLVSTNIYGEISREQELSTELIIADDIIQVKRGGKIALDGTIIYGMTSIDEASITGESIPRNVNIGDQVISSSINCGSGMILIRVDKCKSDSVISKIIELMKNSQINKPKQQEFADTVSSYFVPIVVVIAISTFCIWFSLCTGGYLPSHWYQSQDCTFFSILFSMAVMVIACPCALGLATPTAVMVGMGVATKYGCLIKGGNILEIAHNLDVIVFDKTGTLTYGKPKVVNFIMIDNKDNDEKTEEKEKELLYYLGCAEINSEHPLGKAMREYSQEHLRKYNDIELSAPIEFEAIPGKGIKAMVDGHSIYIGNFKWFFDALDVDSLINTIKLPNNMTIREIKKTLSIRNKSGIVSLLMAVDNRLEAFICLFDSPREQSKYVINLLQNKLNIKCVMLTGDNHNTAIAVAKTVGIDENNVISQVLPQDKHEMIKQLQLGQHNITKSLISVRIIDSSKISSPDKKYGAISMQKSNINKNKADISVSYQQFTDCGDIEKGKGTIINDEYLCRVAMVGDGINDAAALSQSDLGIAIGNGTDIAIEAADVILMNNNLWNIAMLIDLSTTIIHRIYLNFVWALGFNCLGIPIAAGVLYPSFKLRLPPEVAAIAMAMSSLCVLISSIALKSYKSPYNHKNENILFKQFDIDINNNNINKKACGCGLDCNCKHDKKQYMNMNKIKDESDSEEKEIGCNCDGCDCCQHDMSGDSHHGDLFDSDH